MEDDNIFRKIPNIWRYILAIPVGIIGVIVAFILMNISDLWISDPNSLYHTINIFIFRNFLNIIAFFYLMNYTLPKHQFKITLTLSIGFGIYYCMLMGIAYFNNITTWEYIVANILVISALIISCVIAFTQFKENKNITTPNQNNFLKIFELLKNNLNISTLDEMIPAISNFYIEQGIDIPENLLIIDNISQEQKENNLIKILELGTGANGLDNVLLTVQNFYNNQNIRS